MSTREGLSAGPGAFSRTLSAQASRGVYNASVTEGLMAAVVYFLTSRSVGNRSVLEGIPRLYAEAGEGTVREGDLVAIKVHVGQPGTTRFLRPQFVRAVVEEVRRRGGRPFLTDSNTLYRGPRDNAVDHALAAHAHGYDIHGTGAPFLAADGLTSKEFVEVPVHLKHFRSVRYGAAAHHADSLVVLTHFKGHMASGYGGAVKNVGMGLGSRAAKQQMHGNVKPSYEEPEKCTLCGTCASVCPAGAVEAEEALMRFDWHLCQGCGDCIVHCPQGALRIQWDSAPEILGEKMAEVAFGVLRAKTGKALFLNFLLEMTPDCDCLPWSDHPLVPDVGILASTDPVAIDQASADLVEAAPGLPNTRLRRAYEPGSDKFRDLHPSVDWQAQLAYAESLGLGTREYRLMDVLRGCPLSPEEALLSPAGRKGEEA